MLLRVENNVLNFEKHSPTMQMWDSSCLFCGSSGRELATMRCGGVSFNTN